MLLCLYVHTIVTFLVRMCIHVCVCIFCELVSLVRLTYLRTLRVYMHTHINRCIHLCMYTYTYTHSHSHTPSLPPRRPRLPRGDSGISLHQIGGFACSREDASSAPLHRFDQCREGEPVVAQQAATRGPSHQHVQGVRINATELTSSA